jgi:hypothetical protein
MTCRLGRELLKRSKLRNRGVLSSSYYWSSRQHSLFPTVPAERMFILNFGFAIQATPHSSAHPVRTGSESMQYRVQHFKQSYFLLFVGWSSDQISRTLILRL